MKKLVLMLFAFFCPLFVFAADFDLNSDFQAESENFAEDDSEIYSDFNDEVVDEIDSDIEDLKPK